MGSFYETKSKIWNGWGQLDNLESMNFLYFLWLFWAIFSLDWGKNDVVNVLFCFINFQFFEITTLSGQLCMLCIAIVYLYYYLNWYVYFGCCYIQHHVQTICPTENFISMNLLQMSCVITWAWSFLTSEVVEAFRGQKHHILMQTLAL